MRLFLVCSLTLLTGCSTYHNQDGIHVGGAATATWGRDHLIGMSIDDVQACIGIPASIALRLDGGKLLEWTTSEPSIPISVPMSMAGQLPGLATAVNLPLATLAGSMTAQLGGGSGRLMVVFNTNNVVTQVHMAGPGDGFFGEDSLIGTDLLRGCRRDAGRHLPGSGAMTHE